MMNGGESRERLEARLEDYLTRAERGEIAVSRFLTPGERRVAERSLASKGVARRAIFFGGYRDAERTCLFLLPEYFMDFPDLLPAEGEDPSETLEVGESGVGAVEIRGSGFRKLTHRDYLGSLLGLGLERDALGDIALQDEHRAVIFCTRGMAAFLCSNVEKIASDTVKCLPYSMNDSFTDGRNYRPISDTVASPRLDCVVAALTNLSREAAQTAVRSGLVEVEYEPEERTDRLLTPPVTLSVRGHGKFILRAFDGETKKGRLRLRADQYI